MKNFSFYSLPVIILITSVSFPSCGQQTSADSTKGSVLSVEDYAKKIESVKDVQLVDVRTPEEYNSGHLKGYINIDWQGDNFEAEISKLDKTKPTFIHCRSGKRSAAANEAMLKLGFVEVYDLKGGINAWKEAGKPLE